MARESSSSGFHLIAILAGTAGFLLLPYLDTGSLLGNVSTQESGQIAVEHVGPLALSLSVAMDQERTGIIDMRHDARESMHVSLPETWELREVRGASLVEATPDPPALGYVRWSLPKDATISFRVPEVPQSLTVLNPSGDPLKITLVRVFLEDGRTERNVILVKEGMRKVW